jgi:hypothetical protein
MSVVVLSWRNHDLRHTFLFPLRSVGQYMLAASTRQPWYSEHEPSVFSVIVWQVFQRNQ